MKQRTLLFFLVLLSTLTASAYDAEVGGIYYNLDKNTNQAEVTYPTSPSDHFKYSGDIIIAESFTYDGIYYKVTSIGKSSFDMCFGLTSVTIPNSIISIGMGAFYGCSNLSTVTIPNSVTSIGEAAFGSCYSLTSITISENITKIESRTFSGCYSLDSFIIPEKVTSIGDYAFSYCYNSNSHTGLNSVTIPSSVTSIGKNAFDHCPCISSVHITDLDAWCNIDFGNRESNPSSNTWANVFLNGEEITDLVIPDGMTSIKDWTFYGFDMTSVTIPNSVTSIGKEAFGDCRGLEAVHISDLEAWCKIKFSDMTANPLYEAENLYLNGNEVKGLVIPDGITAIEDYAFCNCHSLTSLTIPNSVTEIGTHAFFGCYGMTEVTIPNSVTTIGSYAFDGCSGLKSVTIPNSVTTIGDWAFGDCHGLTSISIGENVKTIGNSAFICGTKVKDVYCYAEDIPTTGDSDVFNEPYMKYATLHVPATSVEAYKATSPWSGFGSIVALSETLRGDANGDGEIGMPDVMFVVNYILGNPAETFNADAADANLDGEIGMPDVMFIVNYILNGKFPDEE